VLPTTHIEDTDFRSNDRTPRDIIVVLRRRQPSQVVSCDICLFFEWYMNIGLKNVIQNTCTVVCAMHVYIYIYYT